MPAPGVGSDAGQTETGGKSEITLFPPALPILATDCFRLMKPETGHSKKSQRLGTQDAGLSLVGGVESPATHGTGGPLTPCIPVVGQPRLFHIGESLMRLLVPFGLQSRCKRIIRSARKAQGDRKSDNHVGGTAMKSRLLGALCLCVGFLPFAGSTASFAIDAMTITDGRFESDIGSGIFRGFAFDAIGPNTDLVSGYIGNSCSGIVSIDFGGSPINAYTAAANLGDVRPCQSSPY